MKMNTNTDVLMMGTNRILARASTAGLVLLVAATTCFSQSQDINEGMDGAWLNPQTPGQGFLLDIDPANAFLFLSWFTYDLNAGAADGETGHRWFSAQGNYSGDAAQLPLQLTRGGEFNQSTPTTTQQAGTVSIQFTSCTRAEFTYAFDGGGPSGAMTLERLAPDVLCEQLSQPKRSVSLTYLGNDGVFMNDGQEGVLIDAFGNFSGWVNSPLSLKTALQNADPPYDQALVMGATHVHGDHLLSGQANNFLNAQPTAMALVPPRARGAYAAGRLVNMLPARFEAETQAFGQLSVTVINTRHFNQFGMDFSGLDNYTFVVEISGKRIVHCGDIDYAADNFQAIRDAIGEPPDVIILPTFNTLISAANMGLVNQFFPGAQVIGAHFRSGSLAAEINQLQALIPDAVIFDLPGEVYDVE